VQAQAAQLISDGALRDRVRIAARQSRKMIAQIGCAKAFCELPEQALLGHSKPETTARYSRVAIEMIAKIESPLEGLLAPRRRRAKRDSEEPPAP
jgi:hypothetical protein